MDLTPLSRTALLHQEQQRITEEIKDAWLFPPRGQVSGFLGTSDIVIVGWRPSPSSFPDEGANKLFYEILKDEGLENAHLTNVVKCRGSKGDPDPEDFPQQIRFFWRELEILSLHGVVPLGDAYDRVAALLLTKGVKPLYRLGHYAAMNYEPVQVKEKAFRLQAKELAALAKTRGLLLKR